MDATAEVLAAVRADPACAAILDRAPSLGLPEWWLTAGAVFQNVWNARTGRPPGWGIRDYDLFSFDDADLSWAAEDAVIRRAAKLFADLDVRVEVRNQARVHLWYERKYGVPAPPFTSAADAIAAFAAPACAVGVRRVGATDELFAPFGLEDTLAMHLRPHRRLAPQAVYDAKVADYLRRWPTLTAEPWTP